MLICYRPLSVLRGISTKQIEASISKVLNAHAASTIANCIGQQYCVKGFQMQQV
jgi:hypothetical protein